MELKGIKSKLLLLCFIFFSLITEAQQRSVNGVVKDAADGAPLPGVSVVVKGTTRGTATDSNGRYQIMVANEETLVFSFVGYESQEVKVGEQTLLNINLRIERKGLEEVVVVGYGVQRKREITGSITKIENEKIRNTVVPSFESALLGQAAGVQVRTGTGIAGSSSIIRIRGIASISASGDPLFVVDGIPITNDIFGIQGRTEGMNINPLSTINPDDIESVEILKDAAAAGIYGSRGSNGVVIITTKRGKKGKLTVDFNTKLSISEPTKKVKMLNSEQWLQLRQEAWENDGNTGPATLPNAITWDQARKTDTDWWDLVTRTGFKQDYNLGVKWGNDLLNVYVGGTLSDDESYMIKNDFRRISGRGNVDITPMENLKIRLSTSITQGDNNLIGNPWEGGLGSAMSEALPIYPVKNPDGSWFTGAKANGNPVWISEVNDLRNEELRTINNISVSYEPYENLNIDVSAAMDYMDFKFSRYKPGEVINADHMGQAWEDNNWVMNWNYSIVGSYNFDLKEDHSFTAMIGHEFQKSKTTDRNIEVTDVSKAWDKDPNYDLDNLKTTKNPTQKWSFISYFTRLNYMYQKKYIAQAVLRIDGSSRFGSNNRYGWFPTFAFGWVMSEEKWMKDIEWLEFLKLKASWGITGNANIDNYAHIGTIKAGSATQPYNGLETAYPDILENPDLKWETTYSFDLGFEARFFGGRIITEFAYYLKKASDVLINAETFKTIGFPRQWQNIAKIENQGIEFSFTSRNFTEDFKWTTEFNIASLDNEVTSLGGFQQEIGGGTNDTRIFVGYPLGVNTLVRVVGIDPEDGRPIYLDKEGNQSKIYRFEGSDGYKVPAGKPIPDFTGAITNSFSYKGFDLSFMFNFSYDFDVYDSSAKRQMGINSEWNFREDVFDHWRKPGDVAKYPRQTMQGVNWGKDGESWFNSDMWLFDGSFMRLKKSHSGIYRS